LKEASVLLLDAWRVLEQHKGDASIVVKSRGYIWGKTQTLAHHKTDPRNQKHSFVPKNNKHQTSVIMSEYEQVQQTDDIEKPPVIAERVKPILGEAQEEREDIDDWNKAKCVGCVGATAGCLTGGFWLSLAVCATGCLYCAKQQEGTAGDGAVARAWRLWKLCYQGPRSHGKIC
jgi:hypothetical protein